MILLIFYRYLVKEVIYFVSERVKNQFVLLIILF